MDVTTYYATLDLYRKFTASGFEAVEEFFKQLCNDGILQNYQPEITRLVVHVVRYRPFLEQVAALFYEKVNTRPKDPDDFLVFQYNVGYTSMVCTWEDTVKLLKLVQKPIKLKFLHFLASGNYIWEIVQILSQLYGNTFVMTKFYPFISNLEKLRHILLLLRESRRPVPKPLTVPQQMNVLSHPKKAPIAPINTPCPSKLFIAQSIPHVVYTEDVQLESRLMSEFDKNKKRAQWLLENAKGLSLNYAPKKAKAIEEEKQPKPLFRAKKAPNFRSGIPIRGNIATVLRKATVVKKEQEEEIQTIENVLQGGSTLQKYKQLEESAKQEEQRKMMEDVERKHLEGLLTFEESILAKQKLIEANKERFKKFMEERDEFQEKLLKWKDEEEAKMKLLVQKGHEIEWNAKQSEMKMKQEKQQNASKLKDESRELAQKVYEKNVHELIKKTNLIRELKALHELRMLNINQTKEFDPNECPNLGLMCQMSIAELQGKLIATKKMMQEQLEQKRRCIKSYNEKRRQMIENVKNFITQSRMSKPKSVPIRPTKLERSPDLDKLRSQLEYARELRKTKNNNNNANRSSDRCSHKYLSNL